MFHSFHLAATAVMAAARPVALWMRALPYRLASRVTLAADGNQLFGEAKGTMVTWVTIGGGLWLVWGVVSFASALDDQNGPDMKRGMWKIIGGAMVMVAAQIFNRVA